MYGLFFFFFFFASEVLRLHINKGELNWEWRFISVVKVSSFLLGFRLQWAEAFFIKFLNFGCTTTKKKRKKATTTESSKQYKIQIHVVLIATEAWFISDHKTVYKPYGLTHLKWALTFICMFYTICNENMPSCLRFYSPLS